jgi:hypothetical protein
MDSMEERLDASFALLSTQILQSRHETNDAILAMRAEMSGEFAAVRSESAGEFAAVRRESAGEFAAVRSEMSAMRAETQGRFEKLESALAVGLEDTRQFIRILYEEILHRIALLGEAWPPRQ